MYWEIFDSLDSKNANSIGVDDLEEPFLALGLVNHKDEIRSLVQTVDLDGNGVIDFYEFLLVIRSIKNNKQNTQDGIQGFFKNIISGQFDKNSKPDSHLSFKLKFSQYRRKMLLNAILLDDFNPEKHKAQNVLNVK